MPPSQLTRRSLIKGAGVSLAAGLIPVGARAATTPAQPAASQGAGFYRQTIGDLEFTLLSDGLLELPTEYYGGETASATEVQSLLRAAHYDETTVAVHVNVGLLRLPNRLVLIDTGAGDTWGPGSGLLSRHLAQAGVQPEEITDIIITHCHADHVDGALLGDGALRYPNAHYHLSDREWAQWRVTDTSAQNYGGLVNTFLRAIEDRVTRWEFGQQLWPGVHVIGLPGHTDGQIGVGMESAGVRHWFLADFALHEEIHLVHPEWGYQWDRDQAEAIVTRQRILAEAAAGGVQISATHLPFPGWGYVVPLGEGYRWRPGVWRWPVI